MIDILINLAEDIKFCLLGGLGIGMITGYLFTKLRIREKHIPVIYKLEEIISDKKREMDANKIEKNESIKSSKDLNEKLNKIDQEVAKSRDITTELENKIQNSKTEQENLKNQYSKRKNILDDYDKEIITLNSKLGLNNTIRPDERKDTLKIEIKTNEQIYIKKCDNFDDLKNQSKELIKETSNLTSNLTTLTTSWDEKDKEFLKTTNSISTLKEKLQKQYDKMQTSKQENDEKIDNLKEQLLNIKNKLS